MKYVIGIDLGVSSCGWSILDYETREIVKSGVALFTASDDAKNRRTLRSSRRLKKRRLHRIERMAILFHNHNIPTKRTIDPELIYKRKKGLTEKLEVQDIVNICYYFARRRGYIPFNLDESQNERKTYVFEENEYPCDYYIRCLNEEGKYRDNKVNVALEDNIRELKQILKTQSKYYDFITEKLVDGVVEIIKSKREFYVGPGGLREDQLSKYGRIRNLQEFEDYKVNPNKYKYLYERLVGRCTVAINEPKAPAVNFYAEKFNFLNDFINTRIKNINLLDQEKIANVDKNGRLTKETIEKIEEYMLNAKSIATAKIEEIIGCKVENWEGYRINKENKIEYSKFEFYKYVLNAFNDAKLDTSWITADDKTIYNKVVKVLTIVPSSENIKDSLEHNVSERTFSDEEIEVLKKIRKNKKSNLTYHSLSEKVLLRAINDMKDSDYQLNYMQVFKKYNYDEEYRNNIISNYTKKKGPLYLIESDDVDDLIVNPQVKKSLRKAIKVINAIIEEQKAYPEIIAIESTREMNGQEKKNKIIKEQNENEKRRQEAISLLIANGYQGNISETNIIKMMLYLESNKSCIYCDTPISVKEVLQNEIEHILPISKTGDDSLDNITCSCSKCNAEKGQSSPYQYLAPRNLFDKFAEKLKKLKISEKKKQNFLYTGSLERDVFKFLNRNLRDTAYGTTALIDEIKKFNIFLENKGINKINVISIPGQLTSKIRRRIELDDKDRNNPLHHAVDATIVASIASNPGIGSYILKIQNDLGYLMKNKDVIPNLVYLIQKVQLDNIDEIKKLNLGYDQENYNYDDYNKNKYIIKRSYEVNRDPDRGIANANIVKVITRDDQTYKVSSIENIYQVDFSNKDKQKLFDKLFSDESQELQLLCFHEDRKTYNHLKEIYNKYKDQKGNPFTNYCLFEHGLENEPEKFNYLIHGIRKYSKKGNGPIIKTLRYIEKIGSPYYIEKQKPNAKKNALQEFVVPNKNEKTKIALESLSQLRTDIYYDIDARKFVFLPINLISVDKNNKINENERLYREQYNKYIGNKNVKFISSIYNGDYIRVYKKDGQIFEGIYKNYHKGTNSMHFYENGIKDKNNVKILTSSDSRFIIYNTNILGKKYKSIDSSDVI